MSILSYLRFEIIYLVLTWQCLVKVDADCCQRILNLREIESKYRNEKLF